VFFIQTSDIDQQSKEVNRVRDKNYVSPLLGKKENLEENFNISSEKNMTLLA
jgi:hypothetical protein